MIIFAFNKLANFSLNMLFCYLIVISLKCFSVNHIASLLVWGVDLQAIFPSSSGTSNIKLTMGKWLGLQVKSNILQCLSLAFVDAHGIAWFHWKLDSLEIESKSSWYEGYSWKENLFSFVVTYNNLGFYDIIMQLQNF